MTADFISSLGTVLLGSGLATASTNIGFEYFRERRKRVDATEYLALQISFLLEEYVIVCADKVSDHSTAISSGGNAGNLINKVPLLPPLPESDAYKLLNRTALNDVLDF